jgi:REP element-mobilizing transposase RayT
MARSRYQIYDPTQAHFLTCTVVNWTAIFTRPDTFEIILDSLAYRQKHHQWQVYAYVIMENHLHLVAQAPDIQKEIASFKSYTARQLVDYFEARQIEQILKQFRDYKLAAKTDRKHQVWQEGSHPQLVQNEAMLRQKIEYIHQNPVARGYVDKVEHWRYSSARNYLGTGDALLPVYTDWF